MLNKPTEWERITLEDVASISPNSFVDGPFGSNLKTTEYSTSGVRLIQLQNIGEGVWFDDNRKFIPFRKFEELKRHSASPGDIAIAKMADPVARACLIPPVAQQFVVVADCIKLTPNTRLYDSRYVVYAINSHYVRQQAEQKSSGTTRLRINLSKLKTLELRVPPLLEQRRIAEILDAADDAIRQTERVIAKLRQVKAGLLHDLLTRGLDTQGRLRDPVAHPKQFKDSPLGRIPREWGITTLGDVITKGGGLIQTGPFGSQLHAYEYTREGVPVIMPQDMKDSHVSLEQIARIPERRAESLERHRVQINDVVFARRGDLSRCVAIGKRELGWVCGTGCLLIRPPEKVINGDWLAAIYQYDASQRQIAAKAVGSTMVNLNTTLLESLLIAMPSYEEQYCIIETYNAANARIRAEEATLAKLRQVKRGLSDDLLTGRVRV